MTRIQKSPTFRKLVLQEVKELEVWNEHHANCHAHRGATHFDGL